MPERCISGNCTCEEPEKTNLSAYPGPLNINYMLEPSLCFHLVVSTLRVYGFLVQYWLTKQIKFVVQTWRGLGRFKGLTDLREKNEKKTKDTSNSNCRLHEWRRAAPMWCTPQYKNKMEPDFGMCMKGVVKVGNVSPYWWWPQLHTTSHYVPGPPTSDCTHPHAPLLAASDEGPPGNSVLRKGEMCGWPLGLETEKKYINLPEVNLNFESILVHVYWPSEMSYTWQLFSSYNIEV